jgi:hypothetical protein
VPLDDRVNPMVVNNTAVSPKSIRVTSQWAAHGLGPMRMTTTVRVCLYTLRAYLPLMFGMLGYRVLQLAGILRT